MTEKKDIFPFIGVPEDYNYIPESELPPLKELAYDFERDDFIIDEDTKEYDTRVLHSRTEASNGSCCKL